MSVVPILCIIASKIVPARAKREEVTKMKFVDEIKDLTDQIRYHTTQLACCDEATGEYSLLEIHDLAAKIDFAAKIDAERKGGD